MTPFEVLREHALSRPDATAVSTPYRVASYRKIWSRIERSTARLQGEWSIRPGDAIAYLGCGHLDALVMYFAAARCGARLLPLEHAFLQGDAVALTQAHSVALILHDDVMTIPGGAFEAVCRPLSSLIATACRHRDSVLEDSAAVSLFEFPEGEAQAPALAAAMLLDTVAGRPLPAPQPRSLDTLAARAAACPAGHSAVCGALFDPAVFAPVVLAGLLGGMTLRLLPQEK